MGRCESKVAGARGRGFLVGFASVFTPLSFLLLAPESDFAQKAVAFLLILAAAAVGGGMTALMCWNEGPRGARHGLILAAAAWLISWTVGFVALRGAILYLLPVVLLLFVPGLLVGAFAGGLLKWPFPSDDERAARKLDLVRLRRLRSGSRRLNP